MIITGLESLTQHIIACTHNPRLYAERMAQWIEENENREYGEEWPASIFSRANMGDLWAKLFTNIHLFIQAGDGPNEVKRFLDLAEEVDDLAKRGITLGEWRWLGTVEPSIEPGKTRDVFRAVLHRNGQEVGTIQMTGYDNDTLVHLIESLDWCKA